MTITITKYMTVYRRAQQYMHYHQSQESVFNNVHLHFLGGQVRGVTQHSLCKVKAKHY